MSTSIHHIVRVELAGGASIKDGSELLKDECYELWSGTAWPSMREVLAAVDTYPSDDLGRYACAVDASSRLGDFDPGLAARGLRHWFGDSLRTPAERSTFLAELEAAGAQVVLLAVEARSWPATRSRSRGIRPFRQMHTLVRGSHHQVCYMIDEAREIARAPLTAADGWIEQACKAFAAAAPIEQQVAA